MMCNGDELPLDPEEELRRRVFFWAAPEAGYDPLATPERNAGFGFPDLPEDLELADYREFLIEMYSGQPSYLQATLAPSTAVQSLRPSAQAWAFDMVRYESSRNWSGLYITPRNGQMFTVVFGKWTVPKPGLPPGALNPDDFHSSAWIGLDGQRAYYHSSLPQIGTEQYLETVGGQTVAQTRTFWQWWSRDNPGQSQPLPLPVTHGHEVMCLMLVISPTLVRFLIKNKTQNLMLSAFDVSPPTATIPLQVSGATAEWIMERSTNPTTHVIEELPDYGTIPFSRCGAVSALRPTLVSPFQGRTLFGARRITMLKSVDNNTRSASISRPNSVIPPNQQERQNFTVSYVPL